MRVAERFGQDVGAVVAGEAHVLGLFVLLDVDDEHVVALGLEVGHDALELVVRPFVRVLQTRRVVRGEAMGAD